jgi:hypothetical protein
LKPVNRGSTIEGAEYQCAVLSPVQDWTVRATFLQFNTLYEGAIDTSEKAAVPAKRIINIIDHLTYQMYSYIQRGLFERHKLIFALMLTMRILTANGKVNSCTTESPKLGCRPPAVALHDEQWDVHQLCLLVSQPPYSSIG